MLEFYPDKKSFTTYNFFLLLFFFQFFTSYCWLLKQQVLTMVTVSFLHLLHDCLWVFMVSDCFCSNKLKWNGFSVHWTVLYGFWHGSRKKKRTKYMEILRANPLKSVRWLLHLLTHFCMSNDYRTDPEEIVKFQVYFTIQNLTHITHNLHKRHKRARHTINIVHSDSTLTAWR